MTEQLKTLALTTLQSDDELPPLPEPCRAVVVMVSQIGSTHKTPAKAYYTAEQVTQAMRDAQAMLRAKQEPVAYGCKSSDGVIRDCVGPNTFKAQAGYYNIPLYLAAGAKEQA